MRLWFDVDGGRPAMLRRLLEAHDKEQTMGSAPDFWFGFFAGWLATMCTWRIATMRRRM